MTIARLNRWQETRGALTDLLAWLDATQEWVEATGPRRDALEDEAAEAAAAFANNLGTTDAAHSLADHRDVRAGDVATDVASPAEPVDLATIAAGLTALRHEVKLQTRSARQDRELAVKTLETLGDAVGQFDRLRTEESARREAAVASATRAAAQLLMDLHDALSRSTTHSVAVVQQSLSALRDATHLPEVGEPADALSVPAADVIGGDALTWFGRLRRRWLRGRGAPCTIAKPTDGPHLSGVVQQIAGQLDSVVEGFRLSLQRLERALATFGVEPIECVGRPLDPETMEAVEVVHDPSRPAGTVVSEIRRGYRQHGSVQRCAQVVVTRTTSQRPAAP